MKRKDFLRNSLLLGTLGSLLAKGLQAASPTASTYDRLRADIGFNHLPNKEHTTMNTVLHKANTRGHANHGWLDTHHTFSFANYRNPERMHFGVLRVLNDDRVAGGRGFGRHPHDNMEIVSIPLQGELEHQDSMGNTTVIQEGDVQVMSAGTGVQHSEKNRSTREEVRFLQIWLFPNQRNVQPRYDQVSIRDLKVPNQFYQVLSPSADDQGVWIHQEAWFHLGDFDTGKGDTYTLKRPDTHGVYCFVLEGEATVAGQSLERRDGFGIWDVAQLEVQATTDCRLLLMEVPMAL